MNRSSLCTGKTVLIERQGRLDIVVDDDDDDDDDAVYS